jgi:long-chain acyl-CoA synthetase
MSNSCPLPLERLYHWEATKSDDVYLRQARDGDWIEYTWAEVGQRARKLATYLNSRNFPEGSRIAIYAQNSPDWFVVDFAIQMAGLVSVPLYPGQAAASMKYVMAHSDCQLIFVGHADKPEDIVEASGELPRVGIYGCNLEVETSLEDICTSCEALAENPLPDAGKLFTLMYTSGTTGNPKGVMHHYDNVSWAVQKMNEDLGLNDETRFFSYLPLSHTAERVLVLLYSLNAGATVSFPQNMETFNADLRSVRPTFFFSVPRLWKKFKEAVESKVPPEAIDAMLADPEKAEGFKQQIQTQLGLDACEFMITGSAPTPQDVQDWFKKLGMPMRNGYGMTENCIHGCICMDGTSTLGSVGKAFNGCEVKIGEDNEILFKSQAMMKGYFLEPEKTAEALRDGYYHTGDTGRIDEQGCLHVTGRLSEAFKTTKGKFVKPSIIEDVMADIPSLGQMCVIGHGMEAPVLLAGLNEAGASMGREAVNTQITSELPALNKRLGAHERVAQVFIVGDEWTIDNELLTPTMKMKRNAIVDRYQAMVEAAPADQIVVWEVEEAATA